ncbi:paired box domain-containing protein [Jatrophihabitans sp. GAS493]|uniref:helix-turn-helix domain-containing protein n=1 Tax=Jatrophihabitans sp. GAS493 TaxID=1907575 RepID=UPI000BB90427|nr:helix-turn-helix domain-containing protein [Jatrophihabitans sp. GAS493]SOD72732.1 paired box domain-containing protein [Jatrophihabitans sp. GAS493]
MPRHRPPLTPAEKKRIVDLAKAGTTRNDIARQLGVSTGTVSKVAAAANVSFNRDATAAATHARKVDNAARRAAIIATLYTRAEEFLEQMTMPHLAFAFGGKDNVYAEHLLERPPTSDIRNLMSSAGTALTKAIDLEKVDASQGTEDVKSMLADLGRALGIGA